MRRTYLKNADKFLDNDPVIIVKFKPSQFQIFVSSNLVNCDPVSEHKLQHVIGGVPARHDITGDESFLETKLTADVAPSRESNCG